MFDDLIFPGVVRDNWQMMPWERIGLTGVLSRLKPKGALEIGIYYGGSLSLTSQYARRIIAIDIDPEVPRRFRCPENAEIRIGSSTKMIVEALRDFENERLPLNFVLIDADHAADAVRRDIELVLSYQPTEPMIIMMHDSGNPEARQGILSANWAMNPHVQFVDCDFIPGQIIEHSIKGNSAEVWGGLALAFLDPKPRSGEPEIRESAATSIASLHRCAPDLSILQQRR